MRDIVKYPVMHRELQEYLQSEYQRLTSVNLRDLPSGDMRPYYISQLVNIVAEHEILTEIKLDEK